VEEKHRKLLKTNNLLSREAVSWNLVAVGAVDANTMAVSDCLYLL